MKIYMASDHAGFSLKEQMETYLSETGYNIEDLGTDSDESVNWAEYGAKVAQKVSDNPETTIGIVICGSGIGVSIAANKFKHVRAALCNDPHSAEMSRKHNNANVLAIGARIVNTETAKKIIDVFLNTNFEGGRHQTRLDYLSHVVEKTNFK